MAKGICLMISESGRPYAVTVEYNGVEIQMNIRPYEIAGY